MILLIEDSLRINDVQERFSMCFPKLKIEFCKRRHHWEAVCPEREFLASECRIGSIRDKHTPGTLEIKSWDKVGEVEKRLRDHFGLNAQVFYKSGQRWIQTGKSDNLTIGELQDKSYVRSPRILL